MPTTMTTTRAERFRTDGYLVEKAVFGPQEVEAIKAEAAGICERQLGEPGEVAMRHALAIHFPHKLSAVVHGTLSHPGIVSVLTQVVSPNVKAMQSMLFFKHAGKPGQAWHQDEAFIPTRDRSLIGAWIALDAATIDNGCLWILPGSHRSGVLWQLHPHDDPEFDSAPMARGFPERDEDAVPVEVSPGDVVFFNGYTLHRSLRNRRTEGFRRALVHHYMSAESLLPWDCGGQVPPTKDNRDIVMVAGTDPYAYKGLQDHHRPYVRREEASVSRASHSLRDAGAAAPAPAQ